MSKERNEEFDEYILSLSSLAAAMEHLPGVDQAWVELENGADYLEFIVRIEGGICMRLAIPILRQNFSLAGLRQICNFFAQQETSYGEEQ